MSQCDPEEMDPSHEPELKPNEAMVPNYLQELEDLKNERMQEGNPVLDLSAEDEGEEPDKEVDPYQWFLRNEPYMNLTPIQVDPETKHPNFPDGLRFTHRKVGMARGMSDENKKDMKVFLDPEPHVVLDQHIPVRGWYKAKHTKPNSRPRPCYTEALLTQPYGGFCAVGCAFCYINHGMRGYRGQGLATVDPNYGDKIAKQFSKMKLANAVYMSSFIDPFLGLEEVYHNTQNTARAALDCGLPIFFLTRKHVPDWAYDYLGENKYNYMQFSINTANPDTWRRISPRAVPLEHMVHQVREMHKRGIYVSIQCNPIVPGIMTTEDNIALIHMLAEAGADHLIFKFVEITYPSAPHLVGQLKKRFGEERGQRFADLFTCNIGGWKTVDEDYRKQHLDIYSRECKKAGVTMALCYEYEYERDAAGEIINKTGISMGPKYMTSDQCHGHRIPMFVREDLKEKFQPLGACLPQGCLTCGDLSGGDDNVPCDDGFLGSAPALEPNHYKEGRIKGRRLKVIQS